MLIAHLLFADDALLSLELVYINLTKKVNLFQKTSKVEMNVYQNIGDSFY